MCVHEVFMYLKAATVLLLIIVIFPATGFAAGTVSLEEIMSRLSFPQALLNEIQGEFAATSSAVSDVTCMGNRLGKQWQNLGGERIGPYECTFANKRLIIR